MTAPDRRDPPPEDEPLPFGDPAPMVIIERTKRPHRHRWVGPYSRLVGDVLGITPTCACGAVRDPAASRRGKSARNRGNSFERDVAASLGVRRVGQYGSPTDVEGDWIAVQCKVGVTFPERIWRWLPSAKGDQLRAVVIGDAPGSSGKRRVLIALDFDQFCDWYGKR